MIFFIKKILHKKVNSLIFCRISAPIVLKQWQTKHDLISQVICLKKSRLCSICLRPWNFKIFIIRGFSVSLATWLYDHDPGW